MFLILGLILSLIVKLKLNKRLVKVVKFLDRNQKILPGFGAFTLVIGSMISLLLFSRQYALAAIAILTFADASSTLIGKFFKTQILPHSKKTIGGTFAGFLIGFFVSLFLISPIQAFIASLTASIIESFDDFIDDNLFIPPITALMLQLTEHLLIN